MSRKLLAVVVGWGAAGLYGCATDAPVINMPETGVVTTRETNQDQALYELGRMLRAYSGRSATHNPIYVQSKQITNDTAPAGVLPNDITRMIITALDKISGPVIGVPFDPNYLQHAMNVQTGVKLEHKPYFVVSGAITEFDKDISQQGTSKEIDISIPIGKSSADAQAGKRNDSGMSRMAIDFSMLKYDTQTATGAITSNAVSIMKETKTSGFSFAIFGTGVNMQGNATKSQGIHAAIRALVEVSIIQLLGREYNMPYWKLIHGAEPDQVVMRRLRDDIEIGGSEAVADFILSAHGHFQDSYPRNSAKAVAALNQVFASQKIDYTATSLSAIPVQVLMDSRLNLPITDNMVKAVQINGRLKSGLPPAGAPSVSGGALQVDVSVPRSEYRFGENMVVSLNVSGGAYVHCFWEQGNGTTIKIFPNRFRSDSMLGAGNFSIPDGEMPFRIEFEYPNSTETVACFASQTDVESKLPKEITSTDLNVIKGYKMDKVRSIFKATGSHIVEGQTQVRVR